MTHFDSKVVTARKAHHCDGCTRIIDPGERYERGAGMDGSTAWTWKWCLHCKALISLYGVEGWGEGITYDDMDGYACSIRLSKWTQYRIDWAEQRDWAGWSMKWRTQAGTLLPVPLKPEVRDLARIIAAKQAEIALVVPSLFP